MPSSPDGDGEAHHGFAVLRSRRALVLSKSRPCSPHRFRPIQANTWSSFRCGFSMKECEFVAESSTSTSRPATGCQAHGAGSCRQRHRIHSRLLTRSATSFLKPSRLDFNNHHPLPHCLELLHDSTSQHGRLTIYSRAERAGVQKDQLPLLSRVVRRSQPEFELH